MTLILSRSNVRQVLDTCGPQVLDDLIERVAAAHREIAAGRARQHPRVYLRYPEEGARRPPGLFSMSALLPTAGRMGARLLALSGTSGDGVLVLFDHATLQCLAIVDDVLLHEYRTGAPAALASRYLARAASRVLGCIGSSGIARGTVTMVCRAVPTIEEVRVYSPNEAHRTHFAHHLGEALGRAVVAVGSPEAAAADADVLVTATDADRPVVRADAIRPGTHINAMARNEIPTEVLRDAYNVTGWLAADRAIDPPLRDPIPEAWLKGELADLVSERVPGRTDQQAITVFLGGGGPSPVWDVAAADTLFEAARRLGVGTEIDVAG